MSEVETLFLGGMDRFHDKHSRIAYVYQGKLYTIAFGDIMEMLPHMIYNNVFNNSEKRCIKVIREGLGDYAPAKDIDIVSKYYHLPKELSIINNTLYSIRDIINLTYDRIHHDKGSVDFDELLKVLKECGAYEKQCIEERREKREKEEFTNHLEKIRRSDIDIHKSGFTVWVRLSGFYRESDFKEFVYKNKAKILKYIETDMTTRCKRPLVSLIGDFKYYTPKQITITKDRCAVVHFDVRPEVETVLSEN